MRQLSLALRWSGAQEIIVKVRLIHHGFHCLDTDVHPGRHALIIPRHTAKGDAPQITSEWSAIAKGIWRMCTVFAWWDVSWWIGVLFSVGSAIFVACGFFYWLPLAYPKTEFPGEATVAGGVTAFIGATLFQIGAILLIVEACNENQTGCFGWALEQAFSHGSSSENNDSSQDGANGTQHQSLWSKAVQNCHHHHTHGIHDSSKVALQHPTAGRKWEWWPTLHELRTHYLHEIGFLGSFILAVGATIFYISGIMALPGIYNNTSQPVLWGVYWLAYLVGGIFFIISSALYVIETQQKWWKPSFHLLGWWIGVWNLIGSVGWTLSASFGYCNTHWCEYQSDLSLLWASVAFLVGSMLLWYEALDKYPVEKERK